MKRREICLLMGVLLLALSLPGGAVQQVRPRKISGILSGGDLHWEEEIHVTGKTTVPKGSTLTIMPGTVVKFMKQAHCPPWELIINGALNAQGKVDEPITFTSGSTVKSPGDWRGISLNGGASVVGSLSYLVIEYADVNLSVFCGGIKIEYCTIRNAYGVKTLRNPEHHDVRTGLFLHGDNITVEHCTITNCTWGIHINQADNNNRRPAIPKPVTVYDCTLSENNKTCTGFDVPNGIHVFRSHAIIKYNTIKNNTWGVEVGDSSVVIEFNVLITNGFGIVIYWLDGKSTGNALGNSRTPLDDPKAYSRVTKTSVGPQPIPEAALFKVPAPQGGGEAGTAEKNAAKVTAK